MDGSWWGGSSGVRRVRVLFLTVLVGLAFVACRPEIPTPRAPPGPALSIEASDPNPFSTGTRIPFELGETLFEGDAEVLVSMRVYNLLYQLVAVPTAAEAFAGGRPIADLAYPAPGQFAGVWDGTVEDGSPAAPGPYFVQVTTGEHKAVGKLLLSR